MHDFAGGPRGAVRPSLAGGTVAEGPQEEALHQFADGQVAWAERQGPCRCRSIGNGYVPFSVLKPPTRPRQTNRCHAGQRAWCT